jgi:uncharacterized protein DUF5677
MPNAEPPDKALMTPALSRICSIVSSLAEKVRRDLLSHPADRPVRWVLTYWFAKAAKSYDAAIVLWKNGYWQDAAMLGRTILEIALQAMYFRKEPEKFAAKFFAHETAERNNLFKDMAEYTNSDEIRGEIQKFFAEQNLDPAAFKRQQNWWGSRSIWDLVKEIQAQDIYVDAKNIYRSQYAPLSMLVHGTPFVRRYYVRQQGNSGFDWRAGAPPPELFEFAATILTSAPTGLLDVIDVLATIWGLDYSEDLSAAREAVIEFNREDSQPIS